MMVFLYSIAGTVFCGWVCPQNTVAEWANFMTRKFLGKRAEVSLDGSAVRVTASKDHLLNWIVLALCFVGASMMVALVPMLYFYPVSAVWSFVSLRPSPALAGSLYWIYTVFVLIVLLDITVLRHFWCRFICVYRVWQHSFKTRQTLHIAYDKSRASDCPGCDYCVTKCFIDLDPRSTDVFDSCINCGECVDACNRMHQKEGKRGLLRFEFGERSTGQTAARRRNNEYSLLGRSRWALPFTFLGLAMFVWGIWTYEPLPPGGRPRHGGSRPGDHRLPDRHCKQAVPRGERTHPRHGDRAAELSSQHRRVDARKSRASIVDVVHLAEDQARPIPRSDRGTGAGRVGRPLSVSAFCRLSVAGTRSAEHGGTGNE